MGNSKRYFLTGGSGLLGSEIRKRLLCDSPTSRMVDVKDPIIVENCYDVIIHCAAYTDVAGAEVNKLECEKTNVMGTMNVCKFAEQRKSKIVYISTDYVYPGKTGNYDEMSSIDPINFYAYTKRFGEMPVMDYRFSWLIVRTSFKPSAWKYEKVFNDMYTSADYVDIISKKIVFLIKLNACGIFNVGTERKSLYDLAKRRNDFVRPISSENWPHVKMPKDCSMNCDKFNNFFEENKKCQK